MGTRSTTRIRVIAHKRDRPTTLMTFYRQMDGYPSGHGRDLADELLSYTMVNGIACNTNSKVANGSGCLAAQLLCHFKHGAGGIYLIGDYMESFDNDYHYDIMITETDKRSTIRVTVVSYGEHRKPIFEGTLKQFKKFCDKN